MTFNPRFLWEKYDTNLSVKEIAKLIRGELKQFKGCKFSVVKEHSNCINIEIKEVPFKPYISQYYEAKASDNWEAYHEYRRGLASNEEWHRSGYTKEWQFLMDQVEKIANAYNFDDSDSMTDYFHVNYYCFVKYDYDCKTP